MREYDIAAFVWPSYTGKDPRTRIFWPEGIGEWQTVRDARAKFEGHTWPRRPLWGFAEEADPQVMEMEIDAAADHGVNVFIYDWYWFDRRPFLEGCLNDGFLKAKNRDRMRFYLMWANHDATMLWDKRNAGQVDTVIWQGCQSPHEFRRAMDRVITRYFSEPNYYRIDGKPVFMIYDLPNLVRGLGSIERTREELTWFRNECKARIGAEPHLQADLWNPGDGVFHPDPEDPSFTVNGAELRTLPFDSCTNYQFCHFANINRPYRDVLEDAKRYWARMDREAPWPYFTHVSVGWDTNPRFRDFIPGIMTECTPEAIGEAMEAARAQTDLHPERVPLITVNSWNEWTETSYLQPDDLYGWGYLDAIRRVFTGND